jgi:hypothetical protein
VKHVVGLTLSILLALVVAAPMATAQNKATKSKPTTTKGIVWKADAENPLDQEWAQLSTVGHCGVYTYSGITDNRISRVTSPVAQGAYVYKVSLRDGDECYGERAELGQVKSNRLFSEGNERWVAFQAQLGSGFPLDPGTWQAVMQLKQLGSHGSPIMSLRVQDNKWQVGRTTNDPDNQWPTGFQGLLPLGTSRTGTWTKFVWHIKFSPDPSIGFLEIYGDLGDGQGMRQLLARQMMSTMKFDETTHQTTQSHARIGIYRDANIVGDAQAYFDGYTVATSREAAEANAFR